MCVRLNDSDMILHVSFIWKESQILTRQVLEFR